MAEYPHLSNGVLMPCASDENKTVAAQLFNTICPQGYSVDEVYPFNSKTKPYCCRWLVKFIKDNGEQFPLPGKDLKRIYDKLTRYNPAQNAKVFLKHNGGRFAAFVTYAVICDCTESQNFELDTSNLPQAKKRMTKTEVEEVVTDLSMINLDNFLKTE